MTVSVRINITADFKKAVKLYGKAGRRAVATAARNTLNETVVSVRNLARVELKQEVPVLNKSINRALSIRKAKTDSLVAAVIVAGAVRIPLIEYRPKPRQTKKGVTYTLGGKKAKRTLIKSAFIESVSGKKSVFKRRHFWEHKEVGGKKHGLPIAKLTGPGVVFKFNSKRLQKDMKKHAGIEWQRRFPKRLKFELSKL